MTTDYRPGVLSRSLAWIDALPGHGWWIYPLLFVGLFGWAHGVLWSTGEVPFGSTLQTVAVSLFYPPYTLASLALINRAAVAPSTPSGLRPDGATKSGTRGDIAWSTHRPASAWRHSWSA